MYEAATAHPAGESTVSRLAATASRLGYAGLVVRNSRDSVVPGTFDSLKRYADAVESEFGVDVVRSVELEDDRGQLRTTVRDLRDSYTIVAVSGGSPERNRLALETPEVDVLTEPMTGQGDVNHILARAAAENGVRFEFDFGPALRKTGGERVQALRGLRKLREMVEYYDAPFVCSVRAESHLELRAPRDVAALGAEIGFDAEQVKEGFAEWGGLVERNRELMDEAFVAPGVRRGKPEGAFRDDPEEGGCEE